MARAPRIGEVYAFVADVIRHRATDDWLADLARADIPAARLHAIEDLLDDEHLAATGFIRAQDHPPKAARTPLGRYAAGTPTAIRRPAPALGTAANCWRKPVTTRPPSTPCSRAAPPFPRFPGTPGTPDGL